jgi:hypothetical protein
VEKAAVEVVMTPVVLVVQGDQLQAFLAQTMQGLQELQVKVMQVETQIQETKEVLVAVAEKVLLEQTQQDIVCRVLAVLEDQAVYKALLLLLQVVLVAAVLVKMVVLVVLVVPVAVVLVVLSITMDKQELQTQAVEEAVLETVAVTHQVLVVLAL